MIIDNIFAHRGDVEPLHGLLREVFPEVDDVSAEDPGEAGQHPHPRGGPPAAGRGHGEAAAEHQQREHRRHVEVRLLGGRHELGACR